MFSPNFLVLSGVPLRIHSLDFLMCESAYYHIGMLVGFVRSRFLLGCGCLFFPRLVMTDFQSPFRVSMSVKSENDIKREVKVEPFEGEIDLDHEPDEIE